MKKILIFTGFPPVPWNLSYSKQNALGGSERAVCYLSEQFSKNYLVYISGNVIEETIGNIKFINIKSTFEAVNVCHFDHVIVSRYLGFFIDFPNLKATKVIIWAHDTSFVTCNMNNVNITPEDLLTNLGDRITNCVCLTEWHKNIFIKQYPMLKNKIEIINNGIDLSLFKYPTEKVKNSFVYSSRPARGLPRIIELWDDITRILPDAILHIASYVEYTEEYQKLISDKKNVNYLGSLNSQDLYKLMAQSEFWFYPVCYQETSCITAMEMLQSEVVCVYYPVAGLVDTLNGHGVQVIPGNELNNLLKLNEQTKSILRKRGKEYTTRECSWETAYEKWKKIL